MSEPDAPDEAGPAAEDEGRAEATGETVGEAKWAALRELERRFPGLDKGSVRFQVVSEGERGLLGVGYEPARVIAEAAEASRPVRERPSASEPPGSPEARVRALLELVCDALGVRASISLSSPGPGGLLARLSGPDLGLVIGKRGQTIDAVQYLANALCPGGPGGAPRGRRRRCWLPRPAPDDARANRRTGRPRGSRHGRSGLARAHGGERAQDRPPLPAGAGRRDDRERGRRAESLRRRRACRARVDAWRTGWSAAGSGAPRDARPDVDRRPGRGPARPRGRVPLTPRAVRGTARSSTSARAGARPGSRSRSRARPRGRRSSSRAGGSATSSALGGGVSEHPRRLRPGRGARGRRRPHGVRDGPREGPREPPVAVEWCSSRSSGGRIASFLHGRSDELARSPPRRSRRNGSSGGRRAYDERRRLLVVEKVEPTPDRASRAAPGVAKKRPLA